MSLLRTLLMGRENGIRSKVRAAMSGGTNEAPDWTPGSSYSAPSYQPSTSVVNAESAERPEPPRDVTPPEGFEVVLHTGALKAGEVSEVIAGGTAICVANVDGEFYAISNTCPHADGPLGEGPLNGSLVSCPYHGWEFDVTDGSCKTTASCSVDTFEVKVEQNAVCVRL